MQTKGTTDMKYHINSRSWEQILLFLEREKDIHTSKEPPLRQFIEAVWYVARSGCQWRLLPDCYGGWRAVHRRFKRWSDAGIWERLMRHVSDPDTETVMVDATIVRSHACSAGYAKDSQDQQALGRSKGGFTTKIHAAVDALGNPVKFILTPGQRNDITQAERLTEDLEDTIVIADKGYDSTSFVESLQNKGCTVVIPSKKNRKVQRSYDKHVYKERHLVECFFGKIKGLDYFEFVFQRVQRTFMMSFSWR